jgi:hypothetical protein
LSWARVRRTNRASQHQRRQDWHWKWQAAPLSRRAIFPCHIPVTASWHLGSLGPVQYSRWCPLVARRRTAQRHSRRSGHPGCQQLAQPWLWRALPTSRLGTPLLLQIVRPGYHPRPRCRGRQRRCGTGHERSRSSPRATRGTLRPIVSTLARPRSSEARVYPACTARSADGHRGYHPALPVI